MFLDHMRLGSVPPLGHLTLAAQGDSQQPVSRPTVRCMHSHSPARCLACRHKPTVHTTLHAFRLSVSLHYSFPALKPLQSPRCHCNRCSRPVLPHQCRRRPAGPARLPPPGTPLAPPCPAAPPSRSTAPQSAGNERDAVWRGAAAGWLSSIDQAALRHVRMHRQAAVRATLVTPHLVHAALVLSILAAEGGQPVQ